MRISAVLRGIRKSDWKKKYGASWNAFMPDQDTISKRKSESKSLAAETSVNWEDDGLAAEQLRKTPNGKYGVVRIPDVYDVVEIASRHPTLAGILAHERCALVDNPYHGNILFADGVTEELWMRAAMLLASLSDNA